MSENRAKNLSILIQVRTNNRTIFGKTVSVSDKGIVFQTMQDDLQIGATLETIFLIPGAERMILTPASIVSNSMSDAPPSKLQTADPERVAQLIALAEELGCTINPPTANEPAEITVEFIDMNREDRATLDAFLNTTTA